MINAEEKYMKEDEVFVENEEKERVKNMKSDDKKESEIEELANGVENIEKDRKEIKELLKEF